VKLLLELSMECESLSRAEALAAASTLGSKARALHSEPGVLVVDTDADPVSLAGRLGLCHHVDEWLDTCESDELASSACDIDVEGPIRVRSTKIGESTVDLASATRKIGSIVGKHKGVDLSSPRSEIRVVFSAHAHIGRAIASIERASFEKRKNRYMPFVYPASLHPKFARALVNLTMTKSGGRLLDPFSGTGAILAEASIIGTHAIGSDFSESMIEGSRANLAHLRQEAELHICDVGAIEDEIGEVDGIATDPPYGRSTSTDGEGLPQLYARAFKAFHGVLREGARVAIAVPDLKLLDEAESFQITGTHQLRVHRSLTRNFCVLERS
jgi:tRNA (guanine10-N2)-dimethyltransferase